MSSESILLILVITVVRVIKWLNESTCGLFWSCFALHQKTKHSAPRAHWMVKSQAVWKGRHLVSPRRVLIQGWPWRHQDLFIREGSLSSPPLPTDPRPRNLRNGSPNPSVQSVFTGRQASLASRVCTFHQVSDKPWAKSELPALFLSSWTFRLLVVHSHPHAL